MNNSKKEKVIRISYLPLAEQDVMKMMANDMYGSILMIKRICKEHGMDPYNFLHFNIAIDMIKHRVTWN